MKRKFNFILSAAAALLLFSCVRESPVSEALPAAGEQAPSSSQKEVVWNINVSNGDDTKGIKSGWEEGDVVYVFFSRNIEPVDGEHPRYLELKYENSHWLFTPKNNLQYNSIKSGSTATALYFPFGNNLSFSWKGVNGFSNPQVASSGFLHSSSVIAVEQSDDFITIGANFIMTPYENLVRFFIPDESAEGVASLVGNAVMPNSVSISNYGVSFSGSSSYIGQSVPGFAATINGDKGWYFYGQINKIGTVFFHLTLPDNRRYTLFKTRNTLEAGVSYTMPPLADWQPAGNDKYVKLGGNYWCTYNAYGKDNGLTQAKDVFSASEYNYTGRLNGLKSEHKIPSKDEWQRLIDDCSVFYVSYMSVKYAILCDKNNPSSHLFLCGERTSGAEKLFYYLSSTQSEPRYYECLTPSTLDFTKRLDSYYSVIKPILDTLGNKPVYNPPVSGEEDF